ncbi:MAG: tetratricopeptide repeat protein [Bacteroidales bacterium]|nr:tetratricopeptide repeat protein [Bacteroidales bacterium]
MSPAISYCKRLMITIAEAFMLVNCPASVFSQGNNITDSLNLILERSRRKAGILNEIAAEWQHISPPLALEISNKALKTAIKENNRNEKANALFNITQSYINLSRYDTSLIILNDYLQVIKELKSTEGLLKYENAIANVTLLQGDMERSLYLYIKNRLAAEKYNYPELQQSSLINIGRIHWMKGDPKAALDHYNKALRLADSLHNIYMYGMTNLFTGIVYQSMGYYELAMEKMQKSLGIFEERNYTTKLPYALNFLGSVYYDLHEYEKSYQYLKRSLQFFDIIGDTWGKAMAYRYLGRTYMSSSQPDSAKYCFEASLILATQMHDQHGEIYSRRFLGEICLEKEKYDTALVLFRENLIKAIWIGDMQEKVSNLHDIGLLYNKMGQPRKALNYFNQSQMLADSFQLFYDNMITCYQMAITYEMLADYKMALRYQKLYQSFSDTIFSERKRKNIDEMQLKYETEKKNNEINRLRLQQVSQEARMKNQRIISFSLAIGLILVFVIGIVLWFSYNQKKKANREIETLLKEIHHRVRNNLQTISSLLSLQSSYTTDSKIKDAVKEGQSRVKSMALIHQMLYQQEKLSKINFSEYIQQLAAAVSDSFINLTEKVQYQVQCIPVELDIDTAVPLGLIANELLVNAYKYAFGENEKGLINIMLDHSAKDKFVFTIKDNGKGLPEDIKIDQTNTLGLKLVSMLVRQIRGEIRYKVNKGTEFNIIFEESHKKT